MIESQNWRGVQAVAIASLVCLLLIGMTTLTVRRIGHRNEHGGRPLSAWVDELNSFDTKVSAEARNAIIEAGSDAVPELIKTLTSGATAKDRIGAADALAVVGHKAGAAAPALITALKDKDATVRRAAIMALPKIPIDPEKAIKAYIQGLSDPAASVRSRAAYNLQNTPAGIKRATPALLKACEDPDKGVREAAVRALESANVTLPADATEVVPPPPGK